jgi:tyrosyl-tRNA synthetase
MELDEFFKDIPDKILINKEEVIQCFDFLELLVKLKIKNTKKEVRRLIETGGLYINSNRIQSEE